MGLRSKLLIAFALVALVPLTVVALVSSWLTRQSLREVIGSSIASISQEKASAIALIVANRVDEAEVLARAAHIREAALRANSTYEGRQQAEIRATIKRLDAEWISARKGGGSALAQSVLANPLSRSLKAYQQRNPDRYGEIFVTDVRGAAIGQTKLLSDHDQAAEGWWRQSLRGGVGGGFIDDRGHDATANALILGVAVPIRHGGKVVGVLKVNYRVKEVLDVVANCQGSSTTMLVRSHGTIVTQSRTSRSLSATQRSVLTAGASGHAANRHGAEHFLMGYSRVEAGISVRVDAPGQRKGISGERWEATRWWVFYEVPQAVALAPVERTITTTLVGGLAALLCAIALAVLLARSIARPVLRLQRSTEIVGRGDFDHRVGTAASDEIGQLSRAFDDMVDQLKRVTASRDDLDEAKQELERSNKELAQFAYVASHDLQEPLRMVASFTQLLARQYEGKLDDKADRYIAYAVDGARRMKRLIDDLLTFSRVGTHGGELKPTDCAEVVQTVLRGMRETAAEAGAEIVVGELPTVMGDRTQLEQVFQNLISNGIKFRVEEPPRIEISARRRADAWELCVSDNGIGIEQSYHERIFVVFQRLHEREKYTGNGIGLSIVKKIVERHGGKVRLESAPGEGTRLFFTLKSAKGTQQKERP